MGNKLPAINIIRKKLACHSCGSSYEVCLECGVRLIGNIPKAVIVCTACGSELVQIGTHETPGEMMGFDGNFISPVYSCPKGHITWCPATHEQPEEIYVKTLAV